MTPGGFVTPGSVAELAGIKAGTLIQEVNRKPVRDLKEYNAALAGLKNGQPILFLIKRGGQTFYLSIGAS